MIRRRNRRHIAGPRRDGHSRLLVLAVRHVDGHRRSVGLDKLLGLHDPRRVRLRVLVRLPRGVDIIGDCRRLRDVFGRGIAYVLGLADVRALFRRHHGLVRLVGGLLGHRVLRARPGFARCSIALRRAIGRNCRHRRTLRNEQRIQVAVKSI